MCFLCVCVVFKIFMVWCIVLRLCFCLCRSASWKRSVLGGLRGLWEDQWEGLWCLLEGEEEEEGPPPRIRA